MNGFCHKVSGTGLSLLAVDGLFVATNSSNVDLKAKADFLIQHLGVMNEKSFMLVPAIGLMVATFIGFTLPDIDQQEWFPLPHRSITHSFYFLVLLSLIALKYSILWGVVFGATTHLVLDSFSYAGVSWFFPFSGYVRYTGGAFVKKGHKLQLYRSNSIEEKMIAGGILIVSLIVTFLTFKPLFLK